MRCVFLFSFLVCSYSVIVSFRLSEAQLLQPDNRCFLEDGGSTLTFFIKEDLNVGQQIGRVNVQGQVGRDIKLKISEDANDLVKMEGKDLFLVTPLDKEGIDGVDAIMVDVVCERLRSTDPSFTIPVHVRVTDVNDNSPAFLGSPYNLSLSEMTVVGTRILTISTIGREIAKLFKSVHHNMIF